MFPMGSPWIQWDSRSQFTPLAETRAALYTCCPERRTAHIVFAFTQTTAPADHNLQLESALCGDANPRRLQRLWMTSHYGPNVVRSVTEIPFHVFI